MTSSHLKDGARAAAGSCDSAPSAYVPLSLAVCQLKDVTGSIT